MSESSIKVNFGCFNSNIRGWIGVDNALRHIVLSKIPLFAWVLFKIGRLSNEQYQWHKNKLFKSVKYGDARKKLKFRPSSVDFFYSSHMIEHLFYDEAVFFLKETFRILKKGGVLRLCFPDWDRIRIQDNFDGSLFARNKKQLKHAHKWLWTFDSMKSILIEIGFQNILRCEFRRGDFPDLAQLENRHGLIMQAEKQ